MKKILIAVLTLLLTAMLLTTTATAQEKEVVVSIPDNNLATAIRQTLGLPTDAVITADAMLDLTRLDAPEKGITDLTGLEHAVNLQWLNLRGGWVDIEWHQNPISDVSPLAALPQLTWLNLADSDVSDVSALANLTQLEWLNLGFTGVSDVSALAHLTKLVSLYLYNTDVLDVSPLAALPQLTWLDLADSGVSDVSALANLTQLERLNLQNCPLNAASHQVHIPAIQANGSEVWFDLFKPIHLPRAPWLVSLIYFRPSDRPVRPNVDAEIDGLIKKAQRFFADQLEIHGLGRKTFQFETDAHGKAVVHHINGKFPNAHYEDRGPWGQEIAEQIYNPRGGFTVYMLDSERSFTGAGGIGGGTESVRGGGYSSGFAAIDNWDWITLAHELAHAFGLTHDWRADANAKRIRTFTGDPMLTSFCAAEWLSVHPAFNPGQPVSTSSATIKMLPPTLASPPNTIRLRFEVTDLDGLHQAQLQIRDFGHSIRYGALIDCQRLTGVHYTVEFVTTKLTPQIEGVRLSVIDVLGQSFSWSFGIDVPSLLPPAKVVSIPDPNLALAVREALELSVSEAITTHAMLALPRLSVRNRGIKDLTGLEHATNLTALDLSGEYISGGGFVDSNAISDWSPLAALPQLTWLDLRNTGVSDVSPLAALTQLEWLDLGGTGVSDVSPLAALPQLTWLDLANSDVSDVSALANLIQLQTLDLRGTGVSDVSALANLTQLQTLNLLNTDVSDVSPLLGLNLPGTYWNSIGLLIGSPLSYVSIHTHIPAMQAKGIEVEFDNVAHPALLKTSGDGQEGAPGATLKTPFVVEAMDEHGKPLVGKTVQFENLQGGGTLSATVVKTDARGKARVTLTLGRAPGVNKVKASSEGIQSWVLFTAVGTGAVPQLVADVNGDGMVDLADLAIVAQAMGKPVENPRADVNGDGVVDGEDFAQVAANLGEGEAAAPSQAALPAVLTREKVEWALNLLHAENTGSPAFRRGIAKLEGFLALLIPDKTLLLANYPNPFNPETWIPYQLSEPAEVTVTIYAANGAVVRTLDLGHRRAGSYASRSRAAYWDGRNAQGEPVASGVYFYTLTARDFAATRKMLILK